MTLRQIWLGIALLALIAGPLACRGDGEAAAVDPLLEQARELAQRIIVADTHIDVPYRLNRKMEDVGERTEGGDFDYPRAQEGGLDVAFMSVFVPPELQEKGGGKELADSLIDLVEGIVAADPDKFILVGSVQEVTDLTGRGQVAFMLVHPGIQPLSGRELVSLRVPQYEPGRLRGAASENDCDIRFPGRDEPEPARHSLHVEHPVNCSQR